MPAKFQVTIHMVSSVDGYIATPDNDISWMQSTDHYKKGVTLSKEDITNFLKSIDCYIMGSHTYEHALELGWAYGETPVIVLTSRDLPINRKTVKCYCGDLNTLISHHLKPNFQNVWVVGGAAVARDFLRAELHMKLLYQLCPLF